jgi:hypothetical protein
LLAKEGWDGTPDGNYTVKSGYQFDKWIKKLDQNYN